MALCLPERCFWPAQTRKNLNFLRCIHVFDLVLKYCSDINEGIWLQLLLYFIVMIHIAALVLGMSFLFWISDSKMKFTRVALSRKRLQLESESDLTTTGLFLEIFVGICLVPSTSCPHGLKTAWIAHFLFFFDDIKFFR